MDWKKIGSSPAFIILGIVLLVVGIPGTLDDASVWKRWIGSMSPFNSGIFMGFGGVVILLWLIATMAHRRLSPKQKRIIGELAAYGAGNVGIHPQTCAEIWTANPRKKAAVQFRVSQAIGTGALKIKKIRFGVSLVSVRDFTEFLIKHGEITRSSVLKHAPHILKDGE